MIEAQGFVKEQLPASQKQLKDLTGTKYTFKPL